MYSYFDNYKQSIYHGKKFLKVIIVFLKHRNMFPDNIVQACSQTVMTHYKKKAQSPPSTAATTTALTILNSTTNATNETTEVVIRVIRELKYVDGTNVMGLVVFCIIFGIFISHSKSEAQILYDFFYVMNELIMKIIALIMWYSPFGILCLVSSNIIKIDDMAKTASRLSIYMATVILGLIIHSMFTIQLLYFAITRKNPFKFLKGMLQAWLTAIGTASRYFFLTRKIIYQLFISIWIHSKYYRPNSSRKFKIFLIYFFSSATLPITFRCLEENNRVDKRVTRFMLPLGATINMDGTALYQCVATIFIAQLNGYPLTFGHLVSIR
jgi:solute carrier family 1 (high affinity glutamate transporter) protein 2